jgi:hypothetical protein
VSNLGVPKVLYQSQVTSSEIHNEQSSSEQVFLRVLQFFPDNHHFTTAPYLSITVPQGV